MHANDANATQLAVAALSGGGGAWRVGDDDYQSATTTITPPPFSIVTHSVLVAGLCADRSSQTDESTDEIDRCVCARAIHDSIADDAETPTRLTTRLTKSIGAAAALASEHCARADAPLLVTTQPASAVGVAAVLQLTYCPVDPFAGRCVCVCVCVCAVSYTHLPSPRD